MALLISTISNIQFDIGSFESNACGRVLTLVTPKKKCLRSVGPRLLLQLNIWFAIVGKNDILQFRSWFDQILQLSGWQLIKFNNLLGMSLWPPEFGWWKLLRHLGVIGSVIVASRILMIGISELIAFSCYDFKVFEFASVDSWDPWGRQSRSQVARVRLRRPTQFKGVPFSILGAL